MILREKLVALGVIEVMTYAFVSKKDIENLGVKDSEILKIENPLSSEQDYLRTSLLPSHLRAAYNNQKSNYNSMFEISRVSKKQGNAAEEKWALGITVWGEDSLLRLKGLIDSIFGWHKIDPNIERTKNSYLYIEQRSANIKDYGIFGQLKPALLKSFGLRNELSFAELDIEKIINKDFTIKAKPLLPYQIVYKDITIELPINTLYSEVKLVLHGITHSVDFVDEFISDELLNSSRKRLTTKVGFDLGPNPKSDEISKHLQSCSKKLGALEKAKVL